MNYSSKDLDLLSVAMSKAQSKFHAPEKTRSVDAGGKKYSYATLDDVWNVIQQPLQENGLVIFQMERVIDGVPCFVTRLQHTSGQWIEGHAKLFDAKEIQTTNKYGVLSNVNQDKGAMLTYFRRYGLTSMLGLNGEDDDDANRLTPQEPMPKNTPETQPEPKVASDKELAAIQKLFEQHPDVKKLVEDKMGQKPISLLNYEVFLKMRKFAIDKVNEKLAAV